MPCLSGLLPSVPILAPRLSRITSLPWHYVLDPWLQVTAVWCFFSFKIFLVNFGEAGLRPDDLLLLISLSGLVLTGRMARTPISLPVRLYLFYAGVELLSAAWNGYQGRVQFLYSLVFVLRIVEYLIFYFIGYWLARKRFRFPRVANVYFFMICAAVPLQMIGILPVPNTFGTSRASANTNGPYELAVVCGFLLCYLAYRKRRAKTGIALFALILLTVSRITLAASLLSLVHFGFTHTRSRLKLAVVTVSLLLVGTGVYAVANSGLLAGGLFERVANSKSYSLSDIPYVYDAAPVAKTATDYFNGSFSDLNGLDVSSFTGDTSGVIRFTRWITLLKSNLAHVDSILVGLGPSFGSAAVDGYFTRCYVETGVLGTLCFLVFLASLFLTRRRSSWYFREYVLIMIVSGLFIDIFLSYKCMLLLWLWHGMNQYHAPRSGQASASALLSGDTPIPALEAACLEG